MIKKRIILLAIVASCLTVGIGLAALMNSVTIPNHIQIETVNVGAYWDFECTNNVTSIEWGVLGKGGSDNKQMYIKNQGTVNMNLSLTTENWNPAEAASNVTLTWDAEGTTIIPDEVLQVTLTLSISANIPDTITDVYFDAKITGTE